MTVTSGSGCSEVVSSLHYEWHVFGQRVCSLAKHHGRNTNRAQDDWQQTKLPLVGDARVLMWPNVILNSKMTVLFWVSSFDGVFQHTVTWNLNPMSVCGSGGLLPLSTWPNHTDSWWHILFDMSNSKHYLAGKVNKTIISFTELLFFGLMSRAGSHFEVAHTLNIKILNYSVGRGEVFFLWEEQWGLFKLLAEGFMKTSTLL